MSSLTTTHPLFLIGVASLAALLPVLMGAVTSYVKVSVVIGMVRSALGTQNVPGPLVVTALSIALTWFIMAPVAKLSFERVSSVELRSIQKDPTIEKLSLLAPAVEPWREFLFTHSGKRELRAIAHLVPGSTPGEGEPSPGSVELRVLITSFLLTELRQAFSMAFVVLLPFLVIDMVVANVLVGMGMFMVSPVMISLPLKLILFVMSDAWLLLVQGLIRSYQL